MVVGLDKFREHFADHADHYVVIGGTACSMIFEEVGIAFRQTDDIDMVLCVEILDPSFAQSLKAFLDGGGYQARERSNGRREFYRFHKPSDPTYPAMLELFARKPKSLEIPEDVGLTVVEVSDETLSLSAILLDTDYYEALLESRRAIDDILVLDERLLIPFKARAFVDLSHRKEAGDETAKGSDIKKHRNDVFRLLQLLPTDRPIEVAEPLKADLRTYVKIVSEIKDFDPNSFDVPIDRETGLAMMTRLYQL
jgi:hypothetical protein